MTETITVQCENPSAHGARRSVIVLREYHAVDGDPEESRWRWWVPDPWVARHEAAQPILLAGDRPYSIDEHDEHSTLREVHVIACPGCGRASVSARTSTLWAALDRFRHAGTAIISLSQLAASVGGDWRE